MFIAGDPSGDILAAELARALRSGAVPFSPRLIGAGGPAMAAAGVELAHDLTRHSVIGLEILKKYSQLRRVFHDLLAVAGRERPDVIVGVDYGGFNLRFAAAIRKMIKAESGPFHNWRPKLVQYVSPQVWASRPGRARRMEHTHDLLLSILPFEPAWYREHAPGLRVEFVGHPIVERHAANVECGVRNAESATPTVLLLPGSRAGELRRHLPVMVPAARRIADETGAALKLVLPSEEMRAFAAPLVAPLPRLQIQIGGLAEALRTATVALASTGTVTLECAWFGVPTVALYKTSRLTYEIGRRIVTVKFLALPNLLAGELVMPEFVQDDATPEALAGAALNFLRNPAKRDENRTKLAALCRTLGEPGASGRAARAILSLV
jgi:lipid-A-disaccharide synthase